MWIIPKNLHTSDFVPDTAALSLDSTELSEICARSLFVRSKPSPARTWSQKWKRDSWTALLSGRILRPSHGQSFVIAWTSSLVATPASHSAQPESGSEQKTLGTSGHLSQTEFGFSDPSSASLRMSRDTSPSGSEMSLESWEQSVTRRRGEYSLRVKSARLTSASGSSSWPTIRASEYKDVGPVGSKSHDHMLGKHYLCAVVTQEAWQTPTTNMDMVRSEDGIQKRKEFRASIGRKSIPDGNLGEQMQRLHGQAAPANPSTDGSRQGLWPTMTAHTPDMESSGPNGNSGTYLAGAVKQWATPNAFCYQPPENTEQWTKRAEYQQTEKGVNLHKPIQTQVLHEVEKQWRTPSSSDGEGGVMEMRDGCAGKYKLRDHVVAEEKMWRTPSVAEEKNQNTSTQIYLQNQVGATPKAWATPIMGDSHLASTPEVAQKRIEEGKVTLSRQNPGKLNPRWVETLMGLPVGWVMPSCKSPVTIAPTSCDSSATESFQPPQSELF
jgi:hypothetical protein